MLPRLLVRFYVVLALTLLALAGPSTSARAADFTVVSADTLYFSAGPNSVAWRSVFVVHPDSARSSVVLLDTILGSTRFHFVHNGLRRYDDTVRASETVYIEFTGVASGTETATLYIGDSTGSRSITLIGRPASPIPPVLMTVDDTVYVGDTTYYGAWLKLTDTEPITVTSITHTDANFATVPDSLPRMLRHDQVIELWFFAPTSAGMHEDSITISYTDYQSTSHTLHSIARVYVDTNGTSNASCLEGTVSADWRRIEIGDTMHAYVSISNHSTNTITIDSILVLQTDSASYTMDSSHLQRTLPPGTGTGVEVIFEPNGRYPIDTYRTYVLVYMHSSDPREACTAVYVPLVIHTVPMADDTTTFGLDSTLTIVMSGDSGQNVSHLIKFTNTAQNRLHVVSMSLTGNDRFMLFDLSPSLPTYLTTGSSVYGVLYFRGDSATQPQYFDTLVIVAENALQAIRIPIVALANGKLAVQHPSEVPVRLTIVPNPVIDRMHVECSGLTHVTYEVYDLLGHVVLRNTGASMWGDVPTSSLAAGSYILRASGRDVTGRQRIVSSKLVVGNK